MKLRFHLQAVLCFYTLLFTFNVSAANYTLYHWPVVDDDFVIVNVKLNGRSVISDLEGYYTQSGRLLLPISPLNSALGIDLQVENKQINGVIKKSELIFTISKLENKVDSDEQPVWTEDDFDHYIDLQIINTVLNIDADFDYTLMQLSLTTNQLESTQNKTSILPVIRRQFTSPEFDIEVADQFQRITYPVTDYSLTSSYLSRLEKSKNLLTLNSYFDAFEHQAQFRFNKNETTTNQFIKLTKSYENSNQEGLLTQLHYELGDIQSQRDPLIMNFSQGRGVYLSNINPNTSQSFSTITIEEATLPGWLAELYRNGQFVASSESTDENIVRFEDVETFYGNNIFEIRLYGPQGEQLTKTRKISVGNTALAKGQMSYQLELLDSTRNVLNGQSNNAASFGKSISGSVSYGLSDNLTYDMGLNYLTGDEDSRYLSAGLQSNSELGSFKFVGAKQVEFGSAYFAGYRGETSKFTEENININFEYSHLNQFNSAVFLKQNYPLKSRASLSLNSRFSQFDNLSWNLRFLNEKREQKETRQFTQFGINSSYLGGNWSSRFQYDKLENELINQSYWSMDLGKWHWTNSVDWKPFEDKELLNYRSSLRWPQSSKMFNQTQLSYNPRSAAKLVLGHQYTYRNDVFNISLTGQYDSEDEWLVSLGISGTISFDQFNNNINFLPPRSLSSGQLAVETFVDKNKNGIFDTQDQPIADASFTGNYLWKEHHTNSNGQVLLPSSTGGQILSLDLMSLSNPYYQPANNRIKASSHRGGVTNIKIPVNIVNEVEGTLYYTTNNKTKPASGVSVLLLDDEGNIQYETISEYDGYYFFPKVKAGEYSIKLEQNQFAVDNLITKNLPEKIVAPEYGDTVILRDIVLQDKTQLLTQHTDTSKAQYFVQLGVFKKRLSANIVAHSIQALNFPLQLYQHLNHENYYLVAGPYKTKQKAQSVINQAYSQPVLFGSFMIDARKYDSVNWQRIDSNFELPTNPKTQTRPKTAHYYCQYALYAKRSSVNVPLIESNKNIFLSEISKQGKRYTVVLSGPFESIGKAECDTKISTALNEKSAPIIKRYKELNKITDLFD